MPHRPVLTLLALVAFGPDEFGWSTSEGVLKAREAGDPPTGSKLVQSLAHVNAGKYGIFLEVPDRWR